MTSVPRSRSGRPSRRNAPSGVASTAGTRPRRGMTLVELLMSMMMLLVAVGGMVGSSAAVAKQLGRGMSQTVAAGLAQARLDSLTSLSCTELDAGARTGKSTERGVSETWNVTDGRNIKTIEVAVALAERSAPLTYRMIVPCRD